MEDDPSQFVSSCGDRFGSTEFGSHAPVEVPQCALAVVERLGGHAERRGCPALDLPRADPEDFAAADVVIWT